MEEISERSITRAGRIAVLCIIAFVVGLLMMEFIDFADVTDNYVLRLMIYLTVFAFVALGGMVGFGAIMIYLLGVFVSRPARKRGRRSLLGAWTARLADVPLVGKGLTRYYLLSATSGLAWGWIAYFLSGQYWASGVWGGIIASPIIGLLVGAVHRPTYGYPLAIRVFLVLITLYVAAVLFGLAVGVYAFVNYENYMGTLIGSGERYQTGLDTFGDMIWRSVLVGLVGLSFGYFLVLWPVAFANHWVLRRISSKTGLPVAVYP